MVSFAGIHRDINFFLQKDFVYNGVEVDRSEWQGLRDDRPQTKVVEVTDISIDMSVPETMFEWQEFCQPNLPWAEDHFQERIGGEPLNPGEQYKNWPWYEQGVEEHRMTGKFSHTYMERYWPKYAPLGPRNYRHGLEGEAKLGIRYDYGDLATLIDLLQSRPMTRQAYLPIWFPEDLSAAMEPARVPCSLGYLFQWNEYDKALDCYYYMRSCDFNRYLWDDLYLTGRLLQHVCDLAFGVGPGKLHAKIANLHIFSAEMEKLASDYATQLNQRMSDAF
jgi:hypothetical protein